MNNPLPTERLNIVIAGHVEHGIVGVMAAPPRSWELNRVPFIPSGKNGVQKAKEVDAALRGRICLSYTKVYICIQKYIKEFYGHTSCIR
jgi:hypothetical protein